MGHAEPPDRPFLVEPGEQLVIAALTSARLWKLWWRSRSSSQRSTMRTACSTFALSRGRRGLAGRMAVP